MADVIYPLFSRILKVDLTASTFVDITTEDFQHLQYYDELAGFSETITTDTYLWSLGNIAYVGVI